MTAALVSLLLAAASGLTDTPATASGHRWLVEATEAPVTPSTSTPATSTSTLETSDVLEGAQRVSNLLSGPSPAMVGFSSLWVIGSIMKVNNWDWGTLGAFANAFYYMGMVGVPASLMLPLFTPSEAVDPEAYQTTSLSNQVYLLDFKKQSALTGSLSRKPAGRGLGTDIAYERLYPTSGLLWGFGVTYQATEVDSNPWAAVHNLFTKLDGKVGWNAFALLGHAVGVPWIARQEASVRVGPSMFLDWVAVSDEGSAVTQDPGEYLGMRAGVVNAFGYELSGTVSLDLSPLGGVTATYQRGSYPSVSFPPVSADNAALLALVGFDDLRGGSSYTWENTHAELSIPFIGYARRGTLNVGFSSMKYSSQKGTSVNNRGFSIGGSWRF